jgi:hypothetical protein
MGSFKPEFVLASVRSNYTPNRLYQTRLSYLFHPGRRTPRLPGTQLDVWPAIELGEIAAHDGLFFSHFTPLAPLCSD